ncbi:protein Niban 1-like isoform X2 [Antennarius striatus]|uniref:protein Niban 1-like isoform X2 n=1 Tax=Antennarius striatus TaxID=241820 RepID=UPI0035AD8CA6
MGASSSGLLDEAKITNIKELVDRTFQSFSVFYRQQYTTAHFTHLHQELEPNTVERDLLLTQRPQQCPEEVLYEGSVKFSSWNEQGKKRERFTILRRDYNVEIHESMETFSRGCPAKLVLQTAGGSVFTTEEESRFHLEQTCAAALNEVQEDCSTVVSPPDPFAVYLHLPYMGYTCFIFQQEAERDHFLSALKTCIRHCNLDLWCDSFYESQAFIRALRLYRQEKGCYESWEMLLGSEEKVLASQVMEEVLPWLHSQLKSRVKGKKNERIRQWLAIVQETYTLVVEQLTAGLEVLKQECRHTAAGNQILIRSDLDQIMSSLCFLEEKVRACICEDAEKMCSESVAPYMSTILEVLTENISAGILGMQHTLHSEIDTAFKHTNGTTGETKKALATLHSISLYQSYRQVVGVTEKLECFKQGFGVKSFQRLVHSAHLEMEKLLDNAVHTLEVFLQSSVDLQPLQTHVNMDRAKERVLKFDYDSRVVQRRLYQEALVEIILPALIRRMDSKWKTELQQFEQYIFSDYSSFILVHNVYEDVLRSILCKQIETVVQDAASKKSNNVLLDIPDLAVSQYNLLSRTPPNSAPDSPVNHIPVSSPAAPSEEPAPEVKGGHPEINTDAKSHINTNDDSEILMTRDVLSHLEETGEVIQLVAETTNESSHLNAGSNTPHDGGPEHPEPTYPTEASHDLSLFTQSSLQSTDVPAQCAQNDPSENSASSEIPKSDLEAENNSSVQDPCPSSAPTPCTDSPVKICLGSLSEAIGYNCLISVTETTAQQSSDRAVYLTGEMKDNWELQRTKEVRREEGADESQQAEEERGQGKEEEIETETED